MKVISIIGGRAMFGYIGNVNMTEVFEKEDGEYIADEVVIAAVQHLQKNPGSVVEAVEEGDVVLWNDNSSESDMWTKLKEYWLSEYEMILEDKWFDQLMNSDRFIELK